MGVQAHSPFEEGKDDEAHQNEAHAPQPRCNEEEHGVGQQNQVQIEDVEGAQHLRQGATEAQLETLEQRVNDSHEAKIVGWAKTSIAWARICQCPYRLNQ